jgi:glycerol uptake facilitator-like aquaporin
VSATTSRRISAWIGATSWFAASTSFANPAVTIAHSLINTFAGISPSHVAGLIVLQLRGVIVGLFLATYLSSTSSATPQSKRTP